MSSNEGSGKHMQMRSLAKRIHIICMWIDTLALLHTVQPSFSTDDEFSTDGSGQGRFSRM